MNKKKKGYLMVTTTLDDKKKAKKLARLLLKMSLAACIQIDSIDSIYSWQGKIAKEKEFRLMIKTTKKSYVLLEKTIKKNHSYQSPEIIAFEICNGTKDYLHWLKQNTCLS